MNSKLKKLIKEEIYRVRLDILEEGIAADILSLILSPKIKKAMKQLKQDPEFQELERQIKLATEEFNAITKRLERNLEQRTRIVDDMKKSGIEVTTNMNSQQIYNAYKKWQKELYKQAKIKPFNSDWEKHFKK